MPCGGIVRADGPGTMAEKRDAGRGGCVVCSRGGCRHFLIEWDAFIHARCAVKELNQPDSETALVIAHGHEVFLDFGVEEES